MQPSEQQGSPRSTLDGPPPPPEEPSFWQRRSFRVLLVLSIAAVIVGLLIKSQFRGLVASYYSGQAGQRAKEKDWEGAIKLCTKAIDWMPKRASLYKARAKYYYEAGDLKSCLKDLNELLELNESFAPGYRFRADIHMRLKQPDKAIADATQFIRWQPNGDPEALNLRAYLRAHANQQLPAALEDVQQAIKTIDVKRFESDEDHREQEALKYSGFLDTRGFIYHKLGGDENQKLALKDLEKALELFGLVRKTALKAAQEKDEESQSALRKDLDHTEAVMVYHRGQIHEKLGDATQAEADKARGVKLGYDPEKGVY